MSRLRAFAEDLQARHFTNRPLILANVWDAASAHAVAGAGHRVLAFAAIKRVAGAVDVPVTADLEAGPPAMAAACSMSGASG
jgi:2-methylisocitrate lyase-like PEP mutase family enzyme